MVKVLVIDDEPLYYKLVAHALGEEKYQIHYAENGNTGLALAKNILPDVVITDVMMPDITGYDVTRSLRRDSRFIHTPIIVLTAQSGLDDKLKSFEAGADDHISKPFEADELRARLAVLLRRAESVTQESAAPASSKTRARIIAVHSLRGGVGCSTLAVNLALGLNALWKSPTILLDLTLVSGQVALMLNASLKRTWADVARFADYELDFEAISSVVGKHDSGLSFIAAPTFPAEAEVISAETLGVALQLLSEQYEYIVLDLSHDFTSITLQALDVADMVLAVGAPEMASLRAVSAASDTYKKLNYPPEKIKLVINSIFPKQGLAKEKIESALGMPAILSIPFTSDVLVEAINLGQPPVIFRPNELISALLEDFAFHVSKDAHKKTKPENQTDAWKRVYKRYTERRR